MPTLYIDAHILPAQNVESVHRTPSLAPKHTNVRSFGRADAKTDLFSSYNRSASPSKSKNKPQPGGAGGSGSGARSSYGYGYNSSEHLTPAFGAYPGANSGANGVGYRPATPNSRGQYSSAVLDELESQNEEQVGVLTGKVKMLKDVSFFFVLGFFWGVVP